MGWDEAEAVLGSLAPMLADAQRMEETNAWRNPVDLVALLDGAFADSSRSSSGQASRPTARGSSSRARRRRGGERRGAARRAARRRGGPVEAGVGRLLRRGDAHRRFPTSNEFGDWDTALHTFTFANAVEQGLRRSPSRELCAASSTRR